MTRENANVTSYRVIGSVEALEVLMGFHQSQMSRQVLFLYTN